MIVFQRRPWRSRLLPTLLVAALLAGGLLSSATRPTPVVAQDAASTPDSAYQSPSSLSVSGHGSVTLAPDTASVVLGVDVIDASLAAAQRQATERMTAILTAVKDAGIAEDDVQTVNYNVNIIRDYDDRGNPRGDIQYQVSNQVSIKVRDVDSLGSLLDAVVSAGANNVYGISFFVDDPTDAASQARRLAVRDARAKADEMAAEVGMRVGRVLTMSESYAPPPAPQVFESRADVQAAGQPVPVQPGTSAVAVDIQLTYELIPSAPGSESGSATPAN